MSDAFIDELQNKKQNLTSKKSELSRLDAEQHKLGVLIEAEKHSSNGHDKKAKDHAPSKDTRTDIVKNEAKFKEQAKKLDELKSVLHDLHVVGVTA